MKKLLFIFNPTAGRAQTRTKLYDIIEFYTKAGYFVTVYPTQKSGDAFEVLSKLEMQYDLVVCSGGDGTLNEVVSGILASKKEHTLAYIPSGSTNDFGRSVGISMDLTQSLENSVNGEPYAIDVGQVNGHNFVYVAGFGLFTNVSYATSQKVKNIIGHLAYILEGIKAISELKSYNVVLEHDNGVVSGEFIIGLITNSFSVAGFKNPTYSVTTLNDGFFEVILIRMPKNILELQEIILDLLSEKMDSELITYIQSSKIKIHSEKVEWTFDGEYGGQFEEAEILNLKQAISIVVPSTK